MDSTLKIGVTADTTEFRKEIKDATKDATKEIEDMENKISEGDNKGKTADKFFGSIKKGASTLFKTVDNIVSVLFGAEAIAGIGMFSAFLSLFAGAMGIVKKENQEIVNKFAYIKAMLQSAYRALSDIATKFMNWILDGIIKVAYWIDYIVQAWFGISLLAKTGDEYAKAMKEAEKSAGNIKKQLMGFDEANVLQNTSNGKEKSLIPTSWKPGQIDVPDWVKWIADHKDLIIMLAEVVGIAFGAVKTAKILSNIASIMGTAGAAGTVGGSGLAGLFGSLLAITAIAAGIMVIITIAKYIWDDLQRLQDEIDECTKKNQEFHDSWVRDLDPIKDVSTFTSTIDANVTNAYKMLEKSKVPFNKLVGLSDEFEENAWSVATSATTTAQKADEMLKTGELDYNNKKKILEVLEYHRDFNNEIAKSLKEQGISTGDIDIATQQLNRTIYKYRQDMNELEGIWWTIDGDVIQTTQDVEKLNKQKIDDKSFKIKTEVDTKNADTKLTNLLQKAVAWEAMSNPSATTTSVTKKTNSLWTAVKNALRLGLDGGGLVLPVPGHGVPIGSAVMSERRAEAVIPFENPEAMAKIGEAIGKWVNIAIDNKMMVDGRVLATATNNQLNKERFLMNR